MHVFHISSIGVVIYEAMTPQCGRSVVQVLVVRVDRWRCMFFTLVV